MADGLPLAKRQQTNVGSMTTIAASLYLIKVHGWTAQTAMFAAVPGALSQVVVTSVGNWRGEGLALVTRAE